MKTNKITRVVDEIDKRREEQVKALTRICNNVHRIMDDLLVLSKLMREVENNEYDNKIGCKMVNKAIEKR
jgi:polysaccharide pyruvyl transferase WcaK-like protein